MTDPKALTAEQIADVFDKHVGNQTADLPWMTSDFYIFARAIERATREQTASTGEPFARVKVENKPGFGTLAVWTWLWGHIDRLPEGEHDLYAAPVEQAGSPEPAIDYFVVQAFATKNRLSLNETATMVRAALKQAGSTPDETLEKAARACEALASTDTDWDTSYWNQAVSRCAFAVRAIVARAPDETLREALRAIEMIASGHSTMPREDAYNALPALRRALATPTKPEMQSVPE